tara:strand:- start:8827 stop:10125 length:1299 start_codon:yes stop_codon:yes gene_type:complete
MQDTSNYANAMKIRYAKAVSETINRKVVLYDELSKTSEYWTGKHHEQPVYLRSANATGARNEGGTLPDASNDVYESSIINNKFNYVVMTVSNIAEAATADQAGAWASVKTEQLKNRTKDLTDSLNRQFHGDGSGVFCEVASFAGATVTIKGFDDGTVITDSDTPRTTRHLKVGMKVAWGTPAHLIAGDGAGNSLGVGTVSSVSKSAPFTQFNLTGIVGADPDFVAGAVVVLGKATTAANQSHNKECMGIAGIVSSSGALQNIDPATHPEWASTVFDNPAGAGSERPLTEDLLNQAIDAVDDLSTGECDLMVMHTATQRAYLNMLKSKGQERFAPTEMKGGWKALTYHHDGRLIPILSDKDCRHRQIFCLSKAALKIYETSPFAWDESGGSTWKWQSGLDSVTAFGRTYSNMGTSNRAGLARINDIAVTGLVA